MLCLNGQLQGRAEIFTTLISIKNTTNFVLTTFLYDDFFFDRALDRGQVEF